MGINARKPVFRGCNQQKRIPACVSAQSDQHLSYSLIIKFHIKACYEQNFKFLASLCTRGDCFETRSVGNPEDRFSCVVAQIITILHVQTAIKAVKCLGSTT